jgi:hypothetical protein
VRFARFANVFLFALVAGVFWGTWFSLARSIADVSPATFLEVGHVMIGNLAWPMRFLVPAALVSAVPVLWRTWRRGDRLPFGLAAAGTACFVAATAVTLAVNVPIDREIQRWTVATLPSDWHATRDRWAAFHTARTFASLAALAFVLASALVRRRDVPPPP